MKTKTATPPAVISEAQTKMLELLAKGASSKSIAQSLGYKDGTARVYLHALYKRIGVNNKTSAVTWYLTKVRNSTGVSGDSHQPTKVRADSFGDFAVKTDLLTSFGVMAIFIGPHSKMWEVANRLNSRDAEADPFELERIRARSRRLWDSFLRGDFAAAKREYDAGLFPKLFVESTIDAVVLSSMLLLGGYTASAKKAVASMPPKKGPRIGITLDEKVALVAISDAVDSNIESAFAALHQLQTSNGSKPVFRQLVIVTLFHLYKMRGDLDRARIFANFIWADAEAIRYHLQALGENTLKVDNSNPDPPVVSPAILNKYMEKIMT